MNAPVRWVPGTPGQPTLVLLHGSGGRADDLLPIGRFLCPGAPQLALSGWTQEAGQARFFPHAPGGGFAEAALDHAVDRLLATLTQAAAAHDLALDQMILIGYSNGANLIAHTLLTRPVSFRRAVLLHAQSLGLPARVGHHASAHAFASFGTHDPRVSAPSFEALIDALDAVGVTVTPFRHDQFHNLTAGELNAAKAWLATPQGGLS
ncbi:alpha/beta hydrolase [Lacticaseibacillus absianus]|uniref:alpha/beta hydrolase n=1 Tax=Lacticaseibacillus absianus TaxID=2729623 RepID=UPI0015C7506A|nr:hypothetical protein [Lacticaseibacillus absianus]